ncbi:MAG: LOG family protein [Bacillota bacterium]
MEQNQHRPVKAYKNLDFLNSPDARTIRILAEFIEPMHRFRDQDINDTVVFFGSSRTKPPEIAEKNLKEVEQKIAEAGSNPGPELEEELEIARNQVFLSRYYEDAVELAKRITAWSNSLSSSHRFVVTSGGGPGLMEAANKGALKAGGKSVGLNISIPMEQYSNHYISPELNFEFHYFFMRKFWFIYLAKALVIFPGGFGTLDELFEVLTLVQAKKVTKPMPIIIYGSQYWNEIISIDNMVKYGVICKKDRELIKFCDSVDEAFAYLKNELTRLHLSGD